VVIVPPFENETGDSAASMIAHMAADWITDGIARSRLVEVVNYSAAVRGTRSSSTGPEAGGEAALSAARRLGATILVRGTVLGERDRVAVRAQLIRVGDGRVIFSCEPVTGPSDDPSAVIQGVRQRVLGAFAALGDERFTLWANAESALPRYDAYLAFVQGLDALGRRGVDASRFFLDAARLDTSFTQAKLYLLGTWRDFGDRGHAFRDSVFRAAWAQRDRLTAYDQAALEQQVTGFRADFDGSLVAARRLPQLSPHSAEAHLTHATAAEAANRFQEALGAIHRARALGAQASTATYSLQFQDYEIHHYLGDLEGERAEVERARAEHPEDVTVCLQLMMTRAAMGREKSVDSLFAECRTLDPTLATERAYVNAGREYVVHGFPEAGRRAQERARNWFASRKPPNAEMVAFMDFRLGNWAAVRDFWVEKLQRDSTNTRGMAFLGAAAAHLADAQMAE
jgi:TolB-like protein